MNAGMYERLASTAEQAGLNIRKLAQAAGLTPQALYNLRTRGGQTTWNSHTLNSISTVLAERLDRKPSEVYAYLTDLEPTDMGRA
jgi:hypothetical protein